MWWIDAPGWMFMSNEELAERREELADHFVEAGELCRIPRCRLFSEQAYLTGAGEVKYE